MAQRNSGRLSQGNSPYAKPARPSGGLFGRIQGSLSAALFPSYHADNILSAELVAADALADSKPNRIPFAVAGNQVLYFDCRGPILLDQFGYNHGDLLVHGEVSPLSGATCIVIGARNGVLWVVTEEAGALAAPLDGDTHDALQAIYGFTQDGRRTVKAAPDTLGLTDAQLDFVKTARDIKASLAGGPLGDTTWPLVFSPVPLPGGICGYGMCGTRQFPGVNSVQLSSAWVILPDEPTA